MIDFDIGYFKVMSAYYNKKKLLIQLILNGSYELLKFLSKIVSFCLILNDSHTIKPKFIKKRIWGFSNMLNSNFESDF